MTDAEHDAWIGQLQAALAAVGSDNPARCLLHGELGTVLLGRLADGGPAYELDAGITHLDAASRSAPAGHAGRGFWLALLARALDERFSRAGRPEDLDASIAAFREAEQAMPADDPDRYELLDSLAAALIDRWEARHKPADLDAAVAALSGALDLHPPQAPGLALRYGVLGDLLRKRLELGGDPADIDAAVRSYQEALLTADADERPGLLGALGYALCDRFQLAPQVADVETMVSCLTEAVAATPSDDPERVPLLVALGAALGQRFAYGDDLADLEAAIGRLSEAEELVPRDDPDRVKLAGMLGGLFRDRFARGRRDQADLERAVSRLTAALDAAPPDDPDQADWLLGLGACLVDARMFGHPTSAADGDIDSAVRHLRGALSRMSESDPLYGELHGLLGSVLGLRVHERADSSDLDAAISHLQRSARLPGSLRRDPTFQAARLGDLATLLRLRFERRGAIDDLDAAVGYHQAAVQATSAGHVLDPTTRAAHGTTLLVRFLHLRRPDDLERAVTELHDAFGAIEAGHPYWRAVANSLALARRIRFEQSHDVADLDAAAGYARRALAATPPPHPDRPVLLSNLGTILLRRTMVRPEPAVLDAAVDHLDEAVRATAEGSAGRLYSEMALAAALMVRFQRRHSRADLDSAVERLTSAQAALAGQPGNPYWPRLHVMLASAYRLRGEQARGRSVGLEGLRGWSWEVLLQSGSAQAVSVARFAAEQAAEVAASCLADAAVEEAVQALELGRGLTVYAATVSASVPGRLRDAGREDLAAEWEQSLARARTAAASGVPTPAGIGAEAVELLVPSDLRHRALQVLAGTQAAGVHRQLLEAPTIGEIHAALAAVGADALVYLTPGTATAPGTALLVRAGRAPWQLRLPELRVDPGGELDAYLHTLGAAGGAADDGGGRMDGGAWRSALPRLCDWAWRAAMGPLLAETATWELGREPWLVLVPVGQLGLVPWHAASTRDGGRTRHALETVVLSSTPSARLLHEVARRRTAARDGRALVLGDPTGDLPYAAEEALSVLAAFYPRGIYMGRHPSGAAVADGVPGEILAHMPARTPGLPVLHLACHAVAVSEPPAGSHLRVGGSQRLTVERLLQHAHGRDPVEAGPMVVLSACTTDLPGRDYDEALTLATAFLAAGAASAVGSLWQVPDLRTAMLMFMFHLYANQPGMNLARALRAAQLWMLDPDRRPPEGMPPRLASRAGGSELGDPYAWAAFAHRGR